MTLKPSSTARRVVYYALGGGRGHATRSRLLASWFPPGTQVHFLLPERLRAWSHGLEVSFCGPEDLGAFVAERLAYLKPDLFVVDAFPRGVLGELAALEFPCAAWLVARWLKPAYAQRPEVVVALDRYQAVLGCERTPWDVPVLGAVVSDPPGRCQPCSLLWLGSGPLEEQQRLADFCHAQGAVLAAPDLGQARSDVSELLAGADLVISAAGYNAYHEIVQSGAPAIFWPQARLYDQQELRAQGQLGLPTRAWTRCVGNWSELEAALEDYRREGPTRSDPCALVQREAWSAFFSRA